MSKSLDSPGVAREAPNLSSYDQVPYESLPSPGCHPDRLYTLGRLFGLNPKPVSNCRVLELGCADGGNLIPLAFNLPESRFVGLDLSQRHIHLGRETVTGLGLNNIQLKHAGIMDVGQSWGAFDYIICHGVYSWVPAGLRDKIMDILSVNLADHGLGYIDYNTYPGWAIPETIRRLMLYHSGGLDDPVDRISQSLAIADFLGRFIQTEDNETAAAVTKETERITKLGARAGGAPYIFHEYLEEENQPVYFLDFARQAADHGLKYVGEAVYAQMRTHGFPEEVAGILAGVGHDPVMLEQYMDFLRHRRFRSSILCRDHHQVRTRVDPSQLAGFSLACTVGVTYDLLDQVPGHPLGKHALGFLQEQRPLAVPFDRILEEALARSGTASHDLGPDDPREILCRELHRYYSLNAVQAMSWQAPFTITPGPRPKLTGLALYQAALGQNWLANQCHEPAILPEPLLQLALLLDGTRSREDLLEYLEGERNHGALALTWENSAKSTANPPLDSAALTQVLDRMLTQIAAKAVLAA